MCPPYQLRVVVEEGRSIMEKFTSLDLEYVYWGCWWSNDSRISVTVSVNFFSYLFY